MNAGYKEKEVTWGRYDHRMMGRGEESDAQELMKDKLITTQLNLNLCLIKCCRVCVCVCVHLQPIYQ